MKLLIFELSPTWSAALLTVLTFCLLLILLGYFMNDFRKFFWYILKDTFWNSFKHKNERVFYIAEAALTLAAAILVAAIALLFLKLLTAFVAWLFSDDLISFFTILRGVFSTTVNSTIRQPASNIITGLLILPIIQFLTVFFVFKAIRTFYSLVNKQYHGCYNESDAIFFGLISVLLLILFEIFVFAQNIGFVHFTLLAAAKLPYLFYYLALCHINMLQCDDYRNSLSEYIIMNKAEKKIVFSSWRLHAFSYLIGILLLTPFHFGIQFLSGFRLAILFLMVLLFTFFLLRYITLQTWNYLSTIQINNALGLSEIVFNLNPLNFVLKDLRIQNTLIVLFLLVCLCFLFFNWNLFLMAFIILSTLMLVAGFFLIFAWFLGFLISNFHFFWTDGGIIQRFNIIVVSRYFKTTFIAVGRSILPCCIIFLSLFMLLCVFPKPLKYNNAKISKSIIDNNKEVLYRSQSDYAIPVSYNEIPPFLIQCIINQEDKYFRQQNGWVPNQSNWHGISLSFLRIRGGSNINMQLIKNLSFENSMPHCLSRKISELFVAFQLSIKESQNDILTWYSNSVSFHGGRGYIGLEAASLFAFARHVNQLNYLEQLYLVSTLPRNKNFRSHIPYEQIQNYSEEVKSILVNKASVWQKNGLISKKELNKLSVDTLRFTNRPYRCDVSASTRLFFNKQLLSLTDDAKYITSITQQNQNKLRAAFDQYTLNRYYPPKLQIDEFKLFVAALVVDYRTGQILGHFCNHTDDLTSFGDGFPSASLIKPFVLLEMLEKGLPIKLYDGIINGKNTPLNAGRSYLNRNVGVQTILSHSLNAPMVNIREVANSKILYNDVEDKFSSMGIKPQKELANDIYNYPLGSRLITLWDIAQVYQCLLSDGLYRDLSVFSGIFNSQNNNIEYLPAKESRQIYKNENCNVIKEALTHTLSEGTAQCLQPVLPKKKTFYIKTGSSNDNLNHGYTLLADDKIMILAWLSYGTIVNDRLQLNNTPPIPYGSGARSAGFFASYIYNQITSN